VLHLVRDARGVLLSRLKLEAFCGDAAPLLCARPLCQVNAELSAAPLGAVWERHSGSGAHSLALCEPKLFGNWARKQTLL